MSLREDFSHLPVWISRETMDKAGVCTICPVRMEQWENGVRGHHGGLL